MNIGEKIFQLRTAADISQEELSERIGVSRQSISKWEMGKTLPQIDKVLQLCELFQISTDTLLQDTHDITSVSSKANSQAKYFGTDGFRGEANVNLTSMHAYKIGRFLGWYYASEHSGCKKIGYCPRIVIGKDTRRSSYMLEYALVAGITASGADAYMLHVTTTPSISYVTCQDEFDCGIMITASHNPYYDNGIKIINRYGEKLDDKTIQYIEAYLDGNMEALGITQSDLPLGQREHLGCIVDYVAGRNRYVAYLISLASHSYKHLRIGLDCANGASWMLAKAVFGALGAQTVVIGAEPNGLNINSDCGSTHIETLCRVVKQQHLDLGFAFDGDADRCIAVDENGNVIDGDKILYILGNRLYARGMLNRSTVVSTVMSNSGLTESLKKLGILCEQTAVGDRFVYECMQENDYWLGGEQSGHIIMRKYATTGDGILTAIMLTEEICDKKSSLSKLAEPMKTIPQYMQNIYVTNRQAVLTDKELHNLIDHLKQKDQQQGRIILRSSGTEPLVRIMTEFPTIEKCKECVNEIVAFIKAKGYIHD